MNYRVVVLEINFLIKKFKRKNTGYVSYAAFYCLPESGVALAGLKIRYAAKV